MREWQLQDAKKRFSELVDTCTREGPQRITRRGKDAAVIMSIEEYSRLTQPREGLVEFLGDSPLSDVQLDLERGKDLPREVDL
jgi:prevent-host-death family protein